MVVLCMYSVRTSMSEYIQGVRIPDVLGDASALAAMIRVPVTESRRA
jgi:hypothetical protein